MTRQIAAVAAEACDLVRCRMWRVTTQGCHEKARFSRYRGVPTEFLRGGRRTLSPGLSASPGMTCSGPDWYIYTCPCTYIPRYVKCRINVTEHTNPHSMC